MLLSGCSYVVERSNAGIAVLEESPAPVGSIARGGKYLGWGLSAPAVLALVPFAALAWATPWVDLPTRVPTETGLALWRALGEPELYLLAGNHETASLCFGFILRRSERFLREGR